METETKNTIPLWLAVAITVVVALPFGLWLKEWSLPLWAAFIVWAEYFALGAKPAALKIMVPAYILGVIGAVICEIFSLLVGKVTGDAKIVSAGDIAWFIGLFVAFCPVIYAMKYFPVTQTGSLPFFNGITMGLATFFVGIYASYGNLSVGKDVDFLLPLITCIPAILGGLLGAFLGWFNIVIMFPREVPKSSAVAHQAAKA